MLNRMVFISSTLALTHVVSASVVQLQVTVTNRAGATGVAVSPVTVAFHDGTFAPFGAGSAASAGIQNIAESGNGAPYLAAFSTAYPLGVSGAITATTGGFGPGIYLPGGSGSRVFSLDTSANSFFSFGAMVVPSNDRFIGNSAGIRLFDNAGNLVVSSLSLHGSDIWDAGTEVDAPFGAAFLAGQNGADHIAQGGVITANHDFSPYIGLMTAAGYSFTGVPGSNDSLVDITFSVVPAPGAAASLGLGGLLACGRRRR